MPVIYRITNTTNGRFYVGSAKNLRRRLSAHRSQLKYLIGRAIQKHGWDAFTVVVLEDVADASMLIEREQYWLDQLQPFPPHGYNTCRVAGSTLGRKWTDEQHQRYQNTMSVHPDWAGWNRGRPAWNSGRVWDDATKAKISEAKRGVMVGKKNHKSIPCYFLSPEGQEVHTESINALCTQHGLHVAAMCEVRRGLKAHYKGWSFLRDENA